MESLIWAVLADDEEKVVEILSEPEVNVDSMAAGTTALLCASQAGLGRIVQLLLEAGASPGLAVDEGESPLHVAAFEGCDECVRLLLAHGAAVNARTEFGKTPLMNAAQSGSHAVLSTLLAAGADIKAKDNAGRTVLHWASAGEHDDASVVRFLLAVGAIAHQLNEAGDTPVDYARVLNKPDIENELSRG